MEITAREASLTRINNLRESILAAIVSLETLESYTLNTLYRTESVLQGFDKDLWTLVDYGETE
jgi:hypothetical protein